MTEAKIVAVCTSETTGVQKTIVPEANVVVGYGLKGDAHGGDWARQVSLLANESAEIIRQKGVHVGPGDFGENVLTEGIELTSLPIGTRIRLGDVELEVTQIGKECHTRCAIYDAAGTCVMPTQGIFCRVIRGGDLKPGMPIERLD